MTPTSSDRMPRSGEEDDRSLAINVLGYGLMGRQIASLLSLLGCRVCVWTRHPPDDASVHKHLKLTARLVGLRVDNPVIRIASSLDMLQEEALTIEAIVEDLDAKKALYAQCRDRRLMEYYTTTSSLVPLEIHEGVGGLHFFNPISVKLVEHCSSGAPGRDIHALLSLLERHDYEVVSVQANRGYLANALIFREVSNALYLVEERGYHPLAVQRVYEKLYSGRNIFDLVDLVGVDTVDTILTNLKEADDRIYLPRTLRAARDRRILGRKNKRSFMTFLCEQSDAACVSE